MTGKQLSMEKLVETTLEPHSTHSVVMWKLLQMPKSLHQKEVMKLVMSVELIASTCVLCETCPIDQRYCH